MTSKEKFGWLGLLILLSAGIFGWNGLYLLGPIFHARVLLLGLFPLLAFWALAHVLVRRWSTTTKITPLEIFVYTGFSAWFLAAALAFLLLTLHCAYPWVLYLISVLILLLSLPYWRNALYRELNFQPYLQFSESSTILCLLLVFALLLALAAALTPPLGYDAHEYHLTVPEQYLQHGGWIPFPNNVYAAFPMNMELLFLWPLAGGSAAGCDVINFLSALLTAFALIALMHHWGNPNGSLTVVALFFTTGMVFRLIFQANIDMGLVACAGVLLLGYERFRAQPNRLDGMIITTALGFGLGTKYIALLALLLPFCVMAIVDVIGTKRKNLLPPLGMILFGSVLTFSPWLIRNSIFYANPFYPLFTSFLGGTPEFFTSLFRAAHSAPAESGMVRFLHLLFFPIQKSLEFSLPMGYSGLWLIGLPVLLKSPRDSGVFRVGIFAGVVYILWFFLTQRNDRFLATLLPIFSLLPAYGLEKLTPIAWKKGIRGILLIVMSLQLWAIAGAVLNKDSVDYLFSPTFEEDYLKDRMPHYRAITWLNDLKAKTEPIPLVREVLFIGEAQSFGAKFPAVVPTVFNHHPLEKGLNPTISHILYNEFELDRLSRGYGPLGWPLGEFLRRWIEQSRGTLLEAVYDAYPSSPGKIVVFRVKK